jgi:hypothetical protein
MDRFIYRSVVKAQEDIKILEEVEKCKESIQNLVESNILMTLSLFRFNRNLFLYYECINETVSPLELFHELTPFLEVYPDEEGLRRWVPMIDIFHFSVPKSAEHWKRTRPVIERVGKIARIKPDMLASYIYYHYMLQEGEPEIDNKYCIIGLDENLIFYYEELPKTEETPKPSRVKGGTGLSEKWKDIWQDLMSPHFEYWKDTTESNKSLRSCELLLGH